MRSALTAGAERLRTLPERHGKTVLIVLCVILAIGLGLRLYKVANPVNVDYQGSDAAFYDRISKAIYEDHRYGDKQMENPNDWSPGAPFFYASVYLATGGYHPGAARLAVAFLGLITIVLAYLLGRRLAGPGAGLVAAGLAATYPVFIHNTGRLLSESLAAVTLPAAILAFLWASDEGRARPWAFALPGALLGISALVRPEYLAVGGLFVLLAGGRVLYERGVRPLRPGLGPALATAGVFLLAFAIPLAPWTARNYVVLDKFVPVTTGGGKALYIGTYLPGDGLHLGVKRDLIRDFQGRDNLSATELKAQEMKPLLDRVARKYPDLSRDDALGKIGKENFRKYSTEQPVDFSGMIVSKVWHMWQGSSKVMRGTGGAILQFTILAFALLGLGLLAVRRRYEALVLFAVIGTISVIGGLLLAGTRRNLALMPIVMALAGAAVAWVMAAVRELMGRRGEGDDAAKPAATAPLRPDPQR